MLIICWLPLTVRLGFFCVFVLIYLYGCDDSVIYLTIIINLKGSELSMAKLNRIFLVLAGIYVYSGHPPPEGEFFFVQIEKQGRI